MSLEAKQVRKWADARGIEQFLLDLDDTQCGTNYVFDLAKVTASKLLAQGAGLNSKSWYEVINRVDNRNYEQYGVAPGRWDNTVTGLQEEYGFNNELAGLALAIFRGIYTTPLELLDGAAEGLSILKESGIPMGIVTHADQKWTEDKYAWLNLDQWFGWDDVYIVDANGHKTAKSWLAATQYFGKKPENCVTIGDSPRSDIIPSLAIGILHCFLVDGNTWVTQSQSVPDSVVRIKNLAEIPKVIKRMK